VPWQTQLRAVRDRHGGRHVVRILHVPLACCALEYLAAVDTGLLRELPVEPLAQDPASADILLVSGTVTRANAPTVRALYDAMGASGRPRHVVAFGACAISGGPYWDSYAVLPGAASVLPVDLVVPGCPPPPEGIAEALAGLLDPAAGDAAGAPDLTGSTGSTGSSDRMSASPVGSGR